jgi:MFS family permease
MIPLIVFVSGAIVMSFEILGSRILAPHFGNDLFVWGSLIGIFLSGLTVGYWFGGRLADHITDLRCFALLLLAPGLDLCLSPLFFDRVNHWVFDLHYGIRYEPLIASVLLFFLPSVFMGAIIPYAVKLKVKNIELLGTGVGTIYAFSSLGSIIGTLLTSFYLITMFGVRKIVFGEGILLVLMSVIVLGLYFHLKKIKEK